MNDGCMMLVYGYFYGYMYLHAYTKVSVAAYPPSQATHVLGTRLIDGAACTGTNFIIITWSVVRCVRVRPRRYDAK